MPVRGFTSSLQLKSFLDTSSIASFAPLGVPPMGLNMQLYYCLTQCEKTGSPGCSLKLRGGAAAVII